MRPSVVLTSLLAPAGLASASSKALAPDWLPVCIRSTVYRTKNLRQRLLARHGDHESDLCEYADPYLGRNADATDGHDHYREALERDPNCRRFCLCICASLRMCGPRVPILRLRSAFRLLFGLCISQRPRRHFDHLRIRHAHALDDDRGGIHRIRRRDHRGRRGLAAEATTNLAPVLTCITNAGGRLKCGDFMAAQQSQDNRAPGPERRPVGPPRAPTSSHPRAASTAKASSREMDTRPTPGASS
ncbi:hypothetical protein DL770_010822 [Monosporascus sp. CRB-9-2]|nr:hypothetical protein DL770_010822 [Monosporascus sp. CRB-9-2]